ncbi:unnamed protein product [Cylicocyclus nassatus]|uniref:Uncharacterized protein n=1 Tax=Cylicocyclus nassatus TaxID=53992 RepID=A0AA36H9Z0_CYLNA|nr:unnamed protein product [Cylicocyclus nassatus]
MEDGKVSLSLKKVDHKTREDLNPQEASFPVGAVSVSDLQISKAPRVNPKSSSGVNGTDSNGAFLQELYTDVNAGNVGAANMMGAGVYGPT